MDIFYLLLIILFILTTIFFGIFFGFIYYWHLKKTSFVVVPMIFTFEFFAIGFFIVAVLTLSIKYGPLVFNLMSSSWR